MQCVQWPIKIVLQASSTITTKTEDLTKYITYEADDHFGTWCPRCSWASSHSTGSDYMHTITTNFSNTTCIMQLGRRIHNLLKMLSLHMIILQPLSRHWHFTWEVIKDLPYFPDLVHVTDLISKLKAIAWEIICKERIFWQQFGMRWNRLACQVMPMVFAAYLIIYKGLQTTQGSTLNAVNSLYKYLLYIFFHIPSACYNKTLKPQSKSVWFACLLTVAPVHIALSDGSMYKYRWLTFKCIFDTLISHTATFPSPKCHELWNDTCVLRCIWNFWNIYDYISRSIFGHNHLLLHSRQPCNCCLANTGLTQ
jgi:hypothetical protein